jgi:hypothetical protein
MALRVKQPCPRQVDAGSRGGTLAQKCSSTHHLHPKHTTRQKRPKFNKNLRRNDRNVIDSSPCKSKISYEMKKFVRAVALLSLAAAAPASAFLSSPASLSRPGAGRRSCSARGLGRLRAAASKQEADCLVIGGGISGLSTGLFVSKGASVLVADKSAGKPGGVFETRTEDGFIWEEGPNTFQPQDGTLSLAAEVGLGDQVVATDPKLPRYVYKGGEVYKLPASGGPPDLSGIAGLLGPLGLIKTVIGALSPVSPSSKADETVIVYDIFTPPSLSPPSSISIPSCF